MLFLLKSFYLEFGTILLCCITVAEICVAFLICLTSTEKHVFFKHPVVELKEHFFSYFTLKKKVYGEMVKFLVT